MWNEPSEDDLGKIPPLYAAQNTPWEDTVIYEHFFLGGCDWYVSEYSATDRLFFGYAILNDDLDNAEWGYVSFDEMREVRTRQGIEVDRDLYWKPRKASNVDRINDAHRHQGRW